MSEPKAGSMLREQLSRWTEAGLIDAGQAGRIEAAEQGSLAAAPAQRRLPLVAEVLGYAGAVIAIVAGVVAVRDFWPHIPVAAVLAFCGVVTVALFAAGAVMKPGGEAAFARLRSAIWLAATLGCATFVAITARRYGHLHDSNVALLSEGAWTVSAAVLWWRSRSALQHLSAFAGVVALALTSLGRFGHDLRDWQYGAVLWAVSAAWGAAAYRGWLRPQTPGLVAASLGILSGALLTMDLAAGQALAVGTVAALLALGVAVRRLALVGVGVAGVAYVVPDTASRYLPGTVVAPLAVTVVGLILLALALWLARSRRERVTPQA